MTRPQQYIYTLMENVAEGQISSDDYRMTFAKISRKLSSAEDFVAELRGLYRVAGFSTFALSLMWIAERVEEDSSKTEYTAEEQQLVVSHFRYAVGDIESPPLDESLYSSPPSETFVPAAPEAIESPMVDETPDMPAALEMQSGPPSEPQSPAPAGAPAGEAEFAALMEKFVEAMQSGSDERETLLQGILAQAQGMSAEGSGVPADLREFAQYLNEFLQYIRDNGFMDDVRVMNILSNVSSPVSSWAQSAAEAREGLLAEGTEILRTFKSLFE